MILKVKSLKSNIEQIPPLGDRRLERNNLYPIFLKTKSLNVLIVGGGNVAEEKLTFLLKSSPDAHVTMVSPMFREGTIALAKKGCVTLVEDFIINDT